LTLSGKLIGEPIVQRGPFVMNTADEIYQVIRGYTDGKLVAA
jgi:redox-sensitive bicupin YhaK (pirin superfamily)